MINSVTDGQNVRPVVYSGNERSREGTRGRRQAGLDGWRKRKRAEEIDERGTDVNLISVVERQFARLRKSAYAPRRDTHARARANSERLFDKRRVIPLML